MHIMGTPKGCPYIVWSVRADLTTPDNARAEFTTARSEARGLVGAVLIGGELHRMNSLGTLLIGNDTSW